ncbi:MAG TPA: hypothetical protein PKI38_09750 [Ottowia sp.]|nr:hypothetical protein [Ottowia sp.]HQD48488.1 hypothetical protein [Ottowia sp.]
MDAARVAPRRRGRPPKDPDQVVVAEAHRIIARNLQAMPSDARRDWLALVDSSSAEALGDDIQGREDAQRRAATRRRQQGARAFQEQMVQAAQAHPNVAQRAQRLGAVEEILRQHPGAKTKDVARALRERFPHMPEVAIDTLRKDVKTIKSGMPETSQ